MIAMTDREDFSAQLIMFGLEPVDADRLTAEIEADIDATRRCLTICIWLAIPTLSVSLIYACKAVRSLNDGIRTKLNKVGITDPEDQQYLMFADYQGYEQKEV